MRRLYRLCIMHPMDPRGGKIGGIETHVRLLVARHPGDFSVLFVGLDEIGDCQVGEIHKLLIDGRQIDFFPVGRISNGRVNTASDTLLGSTTLQYALGLLQNIWRIRRVLSGQTATVEIQRNEFAPVARLLALPIVLVIHYDGARNDKMDSLLKRYWLIQRVNEWLAVHLASRIFGVNANIVKRVSAHGARIARRTEVLSVSVDTRRFFPAAFDVSGGIFRICFAGRFDEFKDPPTMFAVLRGLHSRLQGKLEFHYVGATNPYRYAEFSGVNDFTICHGPLPSEGVASVMRRCHAGILTSFFEGMPCYLLEMLASGRPLAAIRLPQFDPLVVKGLSGALIERTVPVDACLASMIDALVDLWTAICAGRMDPGRIAELARPYSVENEMERLFAHHRALKDARRISRPITQALPMTASRGDADLSPGP